MNAAASAHDELLDYICEAVNEFAHMQSLVLDTIFYPTFSSAPINIENMIIPVLDKIEVFYQSHPDAMRGRIERILRLGQGFKDMARDMRAQTETAGGLPSYTTYREFMQIFREIIRDLQDAEQERLLSHHGIDSVTGLRTLDSLQEDYISETNLMRRYGSSTFVLLVKLGPDMPADERILKITAESVTESIRTFDDAYCISEDEIFVFLKQADIHAAQAVISRIHDFFNKKEERGAARAEELLFCTVDISANEPLDSLLSMMRADLSPNQKHIILQDGETKRRTTKPKEETPILRYLKSLEDKGYHDH